MIGSSFAGILMLALMSGGISDADLVALVQPTHYFKSRQIEPSIDKMVDLANGAPKDGKAQIMQLTALRYLADESDALKKSPKYAAQRQTLEMIANGKNAQDPQGFAKDYAHRVLIKLDNAKPKMLKQRPLREDALSWFPADLTFVGAIDLQDAHQVGGNDPFKELLKMLPEREKTKMYDLIEMSGNIRAERMAIGIVEGTGKSENKIFMRFTGKGNQDWMIEAFKTLDGGRMQARQVKDAKGTLITFLQDGNRAPIMMLVGDTDVLIVGFQDEAQKHEDLANEVLDVRAKKKASATTGALKDRLAKVPDKAVALMAGNIPDEMKRNFRFAFEPVPTKGTAYIQRTQQGLDVQVEASMADAQEAVQFVQKVGMLRKKGIETLQEAMKEPQRPGTPPIPFQTLINLMETVQAEGKADKVQVRAFVPHGVFQQMLPVIMGIDRIGGGNLGGVKEIKIK